MSKTRLNINQLTTLGGGNIASDNEVVESFNDHKNESDPHPQYNFDNQTIEVITSIINTHNATAHVVSKTNTEVYPIEFGQPVCSLNDTSVILSVCNNIIKKNVIGLVFDNTISSFGSGFIQTSGILEGTIAQWELVTNSIGGLIPGKYYFLANSVGKITHIPPESEGEHICCIGQSVTPNILSIKIERPVTL